MSGLMDINGFPDGPPTLIGLPLTDLKSGDELYSSVLLAMAEQAETGHGARIDISMLQVAMSWLIAVLPLVDLGADAAEITRTGNAHRRFVPTNVYPTKGNFLYIAVGSNGQWQKLVAMAPFVGLDEPRFANASGRYDHRQEIYRRIGEITATLDESELKGLLLAAGLPHNVINTVPDAMAEIAVKDRLMHTTTPDGRPIRLTPAAVDRNGMSRDYTFAPRYGEHTDAILREIGIAASEIERLRTARIVG
jgi:crotonobetainyl-CoA:carnitine CoA-transferase CaiB-like acyl-CoA transferase